MLLAYTQKEMSNFKLHYVCVAKILTIASGVLVPIARTVKPIKLGDIPIKQPAFSAHSIMKKTATDNHNNETPICAKIHQLPLEVCNVPGFKKRGIV